MLYSAAVGSALDLHAQAVLLCSRLSTMSELNVVTDSLDYAEDRDELLGRLRSECPHLFVKAEKSTVGGAFVGLRCGAGSLMLPHWY